MSTINTLIAELEAEQGFNFPLHLKLLIPFSIDKKTQSVSITKCDFYNTDSMHLGSFIKPISKIIKKQTG
jgi:hypothetical protein